MLAAFSNPIHKHCPFTGLSFCFCPEGVESTTNLTSTTPVFSRSSAKQYTRALTIPSIASLTGLADASEGASINISSKSIEKASIPISEWHSTRQSHQKSSFFKTKDTKLFVDFFLKKDEGYANAATFNPDIIASVTQERYRYLVNAICARNAPTEQVSAATFISESRNRPSPIRPDSPSEEIVFVGLPNSVVLPEDSKCEMNVALPLQSSTLRRSSSSLSSIYELSRPVAPLLPQISTSRKANKDEKSELRTATHYSSDSKRVNAVDTEDEDERFEPTCHFRNCRNERNKTELLVCMKCRRAFHASCCDPPLKYKLVTRYPWSCTECKACKICGSNLNEDTMLICDACDRAFHMECMSPPVKTVPDGEWFCAECGSCHSCGRVFNYVEALDNSSFYYGRHRLCSLCADKYINRSVNKRPKSRSVLKADEEDYRLCAVCVRPLASSIVESKNELQNVIVKCSLCTQGVHAACCTLKEDDITSEYTCKACKDLREGFKLQTMFLDT